VRSPLVDKTRALEILRRQLGQIDDLGRELELDGSEAFRKWQRDTEVAIERIFGEGTRHIKDFRDLYYSPLVCTPDMPGSHFTTAYQDGLRMARFLLKSLLDEIAEYWDDAASAGARSSLQTLETILRRFHLAALQLCQRYENRPTIQVNDEYDVQDLLHSLLRLWFEDVRPEEHSPSYAGATSRMDFLLKAEQVAVEVKLARRGRAAKQVADELIIDMKRYSSHPDCRTLVCFIYDPANALRNPRGLEKDLRTWHEITDPLQ
jgi:hypothetical protein